MNKSGEYVSGNQMRAKKRLKTKTPHAAAFESSNGVVLGISVMGGVPKDAINHSAKQQAAKPTGGPVSANPAQTRGNLSDLHKNSMHIKKLNFIGRGPVSSSLTQNDGLRSAGA